MQNRSDCKLNNRNKNNDLKIEIVINLKLKNMRSRFFIIIFLALTMAVSGHAQDPGDIAERAAGVIEYESMEMTSTLNIYDNRGNVRVRKVALATRKFGEVTKTLIKFISPADVRGTALLIFDYEDKPDDMWIYMPSLRKIRRIVSSERGKSFMGSEFSNADMSKPNLNDFTYSLHGTHEVNGLICWKVESKCKDENIAQENGFSRKLAYIEKNSYLTHKVEYYDLNDELQKILTFSKYEKQKNGKYFAFMMDIENLQNKRKSVMIVDQFQLGSELTESSFSTTNLNK